jgi:hypothetical protein
VTKEEAGTGRSRFRYALTDKGHALRSVIDAMGHWGARWLEVEPGHVTAEYVLWATSRLVDVDRVPAGGLVARVHLAERPSERF